MKARLIVALLVAGILVGFLPAQAGAQCSNAVAITKTTSSLGIIGVSGTYTLQSGWSVASSGITVYVATSGGGWVGTAAVVSPCGGTFMASVSAPSGSYVIYATMDVTGCGGCTTATVGSDVASLTTCAGGAPTVAGTVTIDTTKSGGGKNNFKVTFSATANTGYTWVKPTQCLLILKGGGPVFSTISNGTTNPVQFDNGFTKMAAGTYTALIICNFQDGNKKLWEVSSDTFQLTITN